MKETKERKGFEKIAENGGNEDRKVEEFGVLWSKVMWRFERASKEY